MLRYASLEAEGCLGETWGFVKCFSMTRQAFSAFSSLRPCILFILPLGALLLGGCAWLLMDFVEVEEYEAPTLAPVILELRLCGVPWLHRLVADFQKGKGNEMNMDILNGSFKMDLQSACVRP